MKKIFSFALVVLMLLATLTLTGCDAVLQNLQNLPIPTNPDYSVRTTVTEEEWLAAMEMSNYILKVQQEQDGATYSQLMTFGNDIFYQCSSVGNTSTEIYLVKINDVNYQLMRKGFGFIAEETSAQLPVQKLGSYLDRSPNEIYADLAYDEVTKSYKYEYTNTKYTFCFEEGVLDSLQIITASTSATTTLDFYNIGGAFIEPPAYTDSPYEPTTPTQKAWLSAMNSTNFSTKVVKQIANTDDTTETATILREYTESAYHELDTRVTDDQQTVADRFNALIDNVYYSINKVDSGYEAYTYAIEFTAPQFYDTLPGIAIEEHIYELFNCLKYDAETDSYKGTYHAMYEVDYALEVCFDGETVKSMHIVMTSEGQETILEAYGFGTTVIELPEYTFASSNT